MKFDEEPPCSVDPESWFSDDKDVQATAERVCASCPFQEPCAELRDLPFERALDDDGPIFERAQYGTWAAATLVPPLVSIPVKELTPRQKQTQKNIQQVRVLLAEGVGKTEIGRRVGISHGSVNHIIKTYLTPEEATA